MTELLAELQPLIWVDGELGPAAAAAVPALDHGLTVGDGVFETCKVVEGRPFALTRHLRRLARSATVLGLRVPPDRQIHEAVSQILAAAGPALATTPMARLRITLTGGTGPLSSVAPTGPPRLVVALAAQQPWTGPATVVTVPWTRNERAATAGAKTTSYADNVVALREAHRHQAQEALMANTAGMLCEGTGSNVLVLIGRTLVTPPLSSGCLAGITRELLLLWAGQEDVDVAVADVSMTELAAARQVLLIGTTRDVQQVGTLDGRALDLDGPAEAAVELFRRRSSEDLDP